MPVPESGMGMEMKFFVLELKVSWLSNLFLKNLMTHSLWK